MRYQLEIHSPGSGSVKPVDRLTLDPIALPEQVLYWGARGYCVRVTEAPDRPAVPAGITPPEGEAL